MTQKLVGFSTLARKRHNFKSRFGVSICSLLFSVLEQLWQPISLGIDVVLRLRTLSNTAAQRSYDLF